MKLSQSVLAASLVSCLPWVPAISLAQPGLSPETTHPVRLVYREPAYPARAIARQMPGEVTIQFVLDVDGNPRDVRVVEATSPGIFEPSAVAAVKHWRYKPITVEGQPVEVPMRVVVRYYYI